MRFRSKHFYCPFEFRNLAFSPFPVEMGRGRITGVFHVGPCRWCFTLFFTLECVHLIFFAMIYNFSILSVVVLIFDILLVVFPMLNVLMWVVCVVKTCLDSLTNILEIFSHVLVNSSHMRPIL